MNCIFSNKQLVANTTPRTKKLLRKGKVMPRELKFRVWNEDKNKFMPSGFIGISDGKFIELKNGSIHFDSDDKIVEQFTGLRDKNGKDIFEGDIIRDSDGDIAKVVWDNDHAAEFNFFWSNGFDNMGLDGDDVEIIGNIHENGDLLK